MINLDKKQAFYLIISILIVIDVIMVFYVSFYSTNSTLKTVFHAFDLILCIILWLEFLYGLYYADDKKKYLLNNVLSIWGMLPFQFILFRFFRLIKLVQYIKKFAIHHDSEVLEKNIFGQDYFSSHSFCIFYFISHSIL